jgi:hypothetical protein
VHVPAAREDVPVNAIAQPVPVRHRRVEPSAGLQHAPDLPQRALDIGDVLQHVMADHQIEACRGKRHRPALAEDAAVPIGQLFRRGAKGVRIFV